MKLKIAIISPFNLNLVFNKLKGNYRPVTWTENLVNHLSKRKDVDLYVITQLSLKDIRYLGRTVYNNTKFYTYLSWGRFSLSFFYLFEVLQIFILLFFIKPKLVHGQGTESHHSLVSTLFSHHIITIHGIINEIFNADNSRKKRIQKFLEKKALMRAKSIVIINPYVEEILNKYYINIKRKSVFYISNPINEVFYNCDTLGNTSSKAKLLFCGDIVERKGIMDLLIALKKANDKNVSNFCLYIIGRKIDTNYSTKISNYIKANFNSDQIIDLGYIQNSELPKYLSDSDITILPSKFETAPMIISESLAAGNPVIAYNVGGIKYMIENKVNGFLVKNNNPIELTTVIIYAISNPDIIFSMKQNAIKSAKIYHPSVIANKSFMAYKTLVDDKNKN